MNFIEGASTPEGFRTTDGVRLPLAAASAEATTYGVRPEHLHLDDRGIPAEVTVVEPMGSETQVTMRIGGQTVIGIFRERIAPKPGTVLKITPDISAIHLFGKDGRRVN
jgi:multiple sugar transport system ATP-binding protein